ncbi:hypothetical protein EJ06DRAFT_132448 [Trichodelitschia bisporula]|uniref:Uncharacterized protein n=1 Tax=Trichodelitschia bisporula TaxID=703511 RepID=A0A6G1HNN5_9PEZI|nr:hypothetical protein EJ06DRAFT_132448 [Trichodelitschia bisporula]
MPWWFMKRWQPNGPQVSSTSTSQTLASQIPTWKCSSTCASKLGINVSNSLRLKARHQTTFTSHHSRHHRHRRTVPRCRCRERGGRFSILSLGQSATVVIVVIVATVVSRHRSALPGCQWKRMLDTQNGYGV